MYTSCGDAASKIIGVKTEEIQLRYDDLMCFCSQMNEYLYPRYCQIADKLSGSYLEVYEDGKFVPLTVDDVNILLPVVRRLEKADMMVAYSVRNNSEFDRAWVDSILKHTEPDYRNGIVYVRKHETNDIRKKLRLLYDQGVIYLTGNEPIISQWKLQPLNKNLYKPTWRNDLFAPDMVRFLLGIDSAGKAVVNINHSLIITCYSIEEAEEEVEKFFE